MAYLMGMSFRFALPSRTTRPGRYRAVPGTIPPVRGLDHIERVRVLDVLRVGRWHRDDLGDFNLRIEPAARDGMLQPLVIIPDRCCGRAEPQG